MTFPTLAERLSLFLLLLTSFFLFSVRFRRIWQRIRAAKPDADFKLSPIARRAWRFFSEVLCQTKVIRQRPLPGLAHAFVFWGFCAFALVTLNHIASGFGFPLFHPERGFGAGYWWFAFVSSTDPAHKTPPSGPESIHCFPLTRRFQPDPAARR
jgi:hypothetical protein